MRRTKPLPVRYFIQFIQPWTKGDVLLDSNLIRQIQEANKGTVTLGGLRVIKSITFLATTLLVRELLLARELKWTVSI